MALTEDQVIDIRREVGSAPDDAALDAIFARNGGDIDGLILEVLEIRYADMIRNPGSYSISGKYSESRLAEQLKALLAKINGIRARLGLPPLDGEGESVFSIVAPAERPPR